MSSTRMATTVCTRSWTPSPENMLLDRGVKSEISAVLAQLGKAVSNRNYFDNWPKLMAGQMDRREALVAKAAERGVAVPDHEDYDTWRNVTDFAVGRCEGTHGRPGQLRHPPRLHRAPEESLGSALARVREVLEDDDRHLAATLAGQREGESLRMREERVARLLDDPEKLRELRQQRAERKAEKQAAEQGPAHGACECKSPANHGLAGSACVQVAPPPRRLEMAKQSPSAPRSPCAWAPRQCLNRIALGHRGVPMPRRERRLAAPPKGLGGLRKTGLRCPMASEQAHESQLAVEALVVMKLRVRGPLLLHQGDLRAEPPHREGAIVDVEPE